MTTRDLFTPYDASGHAYGYYMWNGGSTRAAVRIYKRHIDDPLYEREPNPDELRRLAEYCQYWIGAPALVLPALEIQLLRESIIYVTTTQQLYDWLYRCELVGLFPLNLFGRRPIEEEGK